MKTKLGYPDDDGEDFLRPTQNTSVGGQAFFTHTGGTYPYFPTVPYYPTSAPYIVPVTTTATPSYIEALLCRKDVSRVEFDSAGNVSAIHFFPPNDEDDPEELI